MELENKFSALQLAIINDQAALYTCACPVHVSLQITNLRKLFDYEKDCMAMENISASNPAEKQVHQLIADATKQAHQIMEQCLDQVLDLEGWDRTKMEMPAGLRKRIENS